MKHIAPCWSRVRVACLVLAIAAGSFAVWPALACSRSATEGDSPGGKSAEVTSSGLGSSGGQPVAAVGEGGKESGPRPRSDEYVEERLAMVRHQIAARGVRDERVLQAMRDVPRHWFVSERMREIAYTDRPLPIGEGQTISQPYIVALMTEALGLTAESKVLEIGTGSGYQAAVLAEITPHVYTIEIVAPLAERAMRVFKERGYGSIAARIGDGYRGWPEKAPFDAIIVTCAPDHIPPKLVEQLAVGGKICIPVGAEEGVQELVVVTRQPDGSLRRTSLIPVRFVPMTGEAQAPGADRD